MIGFSTAKINIGLSVLGKRQDGFHDIQSIFYPIPLSDIIEIQKSERDEFHSYGTELASKNLITQARDLLRSIYQFGPVHIVIQKKIPLGSGLGGGSSNAVTTMKLLNQLYRLNIGEEELLSLSLKLGSDCPFFVKNTPQEVSGRGEIMTDSKISLMGKYIVLINPGIHISTAEAFQKLKVVGKSNSPLSDWKKLTNDFQAGAIENYPKIADALAELKHLGAAYTSMTGTGSTVYGIFDHAIDIETGSNRWLFQLN